MLPTMLEEDRQQAGWSVGQAAWRLGVSVREYRELEAGERSPSFETGDRICKLYGWPQTFISAAKPRHRAWVPMRGHLDVMLPALLFGALLRLPPRDATDSRRQPEADVSDWSL
jgi:transcriptional regulator with XRE-family HTH domain